MQRQRANCVSVVVLLGKAPRQWDKESAITCSGKSGIWTKSRLFHARYFYAPEARVLRLKRLEPLLQLVRALLLPEDLRRAWRVR